MRALAILFFGLAFVALFTGSAGCTPDGSLAFGPPGMEYVIAALLLVGVAVVALFLAQPRPAKAPQGDVKRPKGYAGGKNLSPPE